MARLEVAGLAYRYAGAERPALSGITFTVPAGEACLVAGRSGAGKSTLLAVLAGQAPPGERSGEVRLGGRVPAADGLPRFALVGDEGARGLSGVAFSVFEEVAFGLENLGVPTQEIRRRVGRVLERLGLGPLAERSPWTLSGGEAQRLVLAASLVMGARFLLLDEPAGQLDPAGARDLYRLLAELKRQGHGLVVATHEEEAEGLCETALLLEDGAVRRAGPLGEVYAGFGAAGLPPPLRVRFSRGEPLSLAPDLAAEFAAAFGPVAETEVGLEGVSAAYGDARALEEVTLALRPGEIVALIGPNGSGKTTLGKLLIGLVRPVRGEVFVGGEPARGQSVAELARRVGYLFQEPERGLFERSVRREVAFGPRLLGRRGRDLEEAVARALALTGLGSLAARHPYDLRPSQRRWLALASVLAMATPVLVLDEPSRGLDPAGRARLAALLKALRGAGRTLLLTSHDLGLVAEVADRVFVLEGGRLGGGPAREVLLDEAGLERAGLRLPPVARLAREQGLGPVLTEAELFAARPTRGEPSRP